jgi:putative NADPH-quinone reductase
MQKMKITAVLGSYRRGGMVQSAVAEILAAARTQGAEVETIDLLDAHIEFCTNCRACTQEAGTMRGACPLPDDMNRILDTLARSDAIVLASPINFWNVTALMKRFVERLVCFAYWPWGQGIPKMRPTPKTKRAVVVSACAAPALVGRYLTGAVRLLASTAGMLGARKVDVLVIGFACRDRDSRLSDAVRRKARRLGLKLCRSPGQKRFRNSGG